MKSHNYVCVLLIDHQYGNHLVFSFEMANFKAPEQIQIHSEFYLLYYYFIVLMSLKNANVECVMPCVTSSKQKTKKLKSILKTRKKMSEKKFW